MNNSANLFWILEVAVEPARKSDQAKLNGALSELAANDTDFNASHVSETEQTVLRGMSEAELDEIIDTLRQAFKLDIKVGDFLVVYRETIRRRIEHAYTHDDRSGGTHRHGHVRLALEPLEPVSGFKFVNTASSGSVPEKFVTAVEEGVLSAIKSDLAVALPRVDIAVTLLNGRGNESSNLDTFEFAGKMAMRGAIPKAKPTLLEPIMKIEVATPEEYIGDVIGDLNAHRAYVLGMEIRDDMRVIAATAPLVDVLGYANTLASLTQDRATFDMHYDRYEKLPDTWPDDDGPAPPFAAALRA